MPKALEIQDNVMEKIEKYVDEVINQHKDKTILISIDKIPDVNKIFDVLKKDYNIQCEKGEVERKDFYYILPKCFYSSEEQLIGLMVQPDVVYRFTQIDLPNLRHTLKATLTLLILVRSRTFFDVYVNKFLSDDKYSYFIVNSNELWVINAVIKSPEFSSFLNSPELIIQAIGNVAVIAYEPRFPLLPKYVALKVNPIYYPDHIGISFDIIVINKEVAYQILSMAFDNMKKDIEEMINKDEQLQKLVSRILSDNENS